MEIFLPISCKCLTYGRVHLLEESIFSYLQQDYPGKREMLIVNDAPFQFLTIDKEKYPDVRIINLAQTFKTIGEKEDFSISQCNYDIISQWDDDDIANPWHLLNINKYFPGYDLLHWRKGIFSVSSVIEKITGLGNSGIVFSKQAWQMVGGYPHENCGADMSFVLNITAKGKVINAAPENDQVSWWYRWGENNYNCSGQGSDKGRPEDEQIIARHVRYIDNLRKRGEIPEGEIELHPHFNKDYLKIFMDFIQ